MPETKLLAEYGRQQVVKDRNYAGLIQWAAGITAGAIPGTKPTPEWVELRIVAERIPQAGESYVNRTMSYFAQDPGTLASADKLMNPFNDEATEATLSASVNSVITGFMPRFAAGDVTDAQVEQWYTDNGFTTP